MVVSFRRSMTLRITVQIFGVYLLITAGLLFLIVGNLRQSYQNIETHDILTDRERVSAAFDREVQRLADYCLRVSAWKDTGPYKQQTPIVYVQALATGANKHSPDFNLLALVNSHGELLWGQWLENGHLVSDSSYVSPGHLDLDDIARLSTPALLARSDSTSAATMLLPVTQGAMYVAIAPFASAGEFMLVGRLLNEQRIADIEKLTQTRITWKLSADPHFSDSAGQGDDLVLQSDSRVSVHVQRAFNGVPGGLIFEVSKERVVSQLGEQTIFFIFLTLSLAGLVVATSLAFIIQRQVLNPMSDIAHHMSDVIDNENFSARMQMLRSDELGLLARSYNRLLERIEQRTLELERLNQELENLAHTDRLTGLGNRRMFDDHLERELRRLRRESRVSLNRGIISLLICDVDFFKQFNDTYGHMAGDACLSAIGQTLQGALRRAADLACRFGGEEFVILLPDCDINGALLVAELIRHGVEELSIPHKSSSVAPIVTISIGVTVRRVGDGFSLETLMEEADRALYRAKNEGRNRVVAADSSILR